MLCEEVLVLKAGPVIGESVWPNVLPREHLLKQASTMAAALHTLCHIKIQDTQRRYLDGRTSMVYKELLNTMLYDAEAAIALILKYQGVLVALELSQRSQWTG